MTEHDDSQVKDLNKYVLWDKSSKRMPPRPHNPREYSENDERHWYDYEFAGWNVEKVNMPNAPLDGPERKQIVLLNGTISHPCRCELTPIHMLFILERTQEGI